MKKLTLIVLLVFIGLNSWALTFNASESEAAPIHIVSTKIVANTLQAYDSEGHQRISLKYDIKAVMNIYSEQVTSIKQTYSYTIWTKDSLELKTAAYQFIHNKNPEHAEAPINKVLLNDFSIEEFKLLKKHLQSASQKCPLTIELDQKTFFIKNLQQSC